VVTQQVKKYLIEALPPDKAFVGALVGGASAGLASSIIRVPTEVVKQRMQAGAAPWVPSWGPGEGFWAFRFSQRFSQNKIFVFFAGNILLGCAGFLSRDPPGLCWRRGERVCWGLHEVFIRYRWGDRGGSQGSYCGFSWGHGGDLGGLMRNTGALTWLIMALIGRMTA
jgi:hypothetical protein